MHSSESMDDNLEECSEGLVEEYSSGDQDLDDYTEAEGDGDDKADTRLDIPPMPLLKRSRQRSFGFNRQWFESFPWVLWDGSAKGMLCKLCRKHSH